MFVLEFKETFDKVGRQLGVLERQEIPFAIARTLTEIAIEARDEERSQARRRFTLRNKWVERGIQARSATKRDLTAEVGSRDWFMAEQETGAQRRPRRASVIAVPIEVRPSLKQRVLRSKFPSRLVKKKNVFFGTLRGGQKALLQRKTKKRLPLRLLYVFKPQIPIPPRFGFQADVERLALKRISKIFGRNLAIGIAQARRRA